MSHRESIEQLTQEVRGLAPKEKLSLVFVSVHGLGFPKGATFKEIYKEAQRRGLRPYPKEIDHRERLQMVGMTCCVAIVLEPQEPELFRLDYVVDGKWLGRCITKPDVVWYPTYWLGFLMPSSPPDQPS